MDELDRIEKEKNKIKVGDVVKITNDGTRYPSCRFKRYTTCYCIQW